MRKPKLTPQARNYMKRVASLGGKARARKTTPEQRREWARQAARARWEKERESRKKGG